LIEQAHLQQQAARLFQHDSANEAIHLQQQEVLHPQQQVNKSQSIENEVNHLHSLEDTRVSENAASQRMNYQYENLNIRFFLQIKMTMRFFLQTKMTLS